MYAAAVHPGASMAKFLPRHTDRRTPGKLEEYLTQDGEADQPGDTPKTPSKSVPASSSGHRSPYLERAYSDVPEIGKAFRWYDHVFRSAYWFNSSRAGKIFPAAARSAALYIMNSVLARNEYERKKMWSHEDPIHNLFVPDNAHVTIPSIWVSEVFPPSEFNTLIKSMEKNGWDKGRVRNRFQESNQEHLIKSRSGAGPRWWTLGAVRRESSLRFVPDAKLEKLPEEFDYVELTALSVGPSLTVVLANFTLSELGQSFVDRAWHANHEPRILRDRWRFSTEDRLFSGMHETQESRHHLHDLAREWMTNRCPGGFSRGKIQQPLMDLLILNELTPPEQGSNRSNYAENLRSLGIAGFGAYKITSPQLPGLHLEPVDERLHSSIDWRFTWTLWGEQSEIGKGLERSPASQRSEYDDIRILVKESVQDFFCAATTLHFIEMKRDQLALHRDNARSHHGEFGKKYLRLLRENVLTSSLDTSSIVHDVEKFSAGTYIITGGAIFIRAPQEWISKGVNEGSVNFSERITKRQLEGARELADSDKEYREILSTVAALGSSIDAFKVQRYAIIVSVFSLIIAIVAILVTIIGPTDTAAFIDHARRWFSVRL
ncbi:MAG: hypothetical protein JWO52_2791 [Gammaproteobacteria bacterium]|nr:hypothetical protein [Gammaproteobacteria bacterium]